MTDIISYSPVCPNLRHPGEGKCQESQLTIGPAIEKLILTKPDPQKAGTSTPHSTPYSHSPVSEETKDTMKRLDEDLY
ncbi:hypothetical protein KOW79_003224 [Hemibagrus wyckioides]|uniref:Uncharacterized protein n=1 Tax=Hemibagrus wyckioides TaxID=337641 RepID=A0A9D3P3R8_9TELE|nr:hypothetical protein KOW79_003224 [Hemibagrus wyckioides]